MTLSSAFHRGAGGPSATGPGLEDALEALVQRGRARWPALRLEAEAVAFAIGARSRGDDADLPAVHAEDLHLALACAAGLRGAAEAFEREHLSSAAVLAAVRRIDPAPAFADEVRQTVRERLFVPPPGRIAEYSGRGPLGAWTRVVAARIALDLRPRRVEAEVTEAELATERDPELRYLQQKYARNFERALQQGFAALDDEQVNLLRLQYVDGLRTSQIAALFQVDRSTIKRRLSACREVMLLRTRAALQEELGVSPESFESLSRLLASQLHLSVARLIQERG